MPVASGVGWTDDRVKLLKSLLADGRTASQIAGELGGVTRNSVLGKIHRLGLSSTRPRQTATPRVRRSYQPRRTVTRPAVRTGPDAPQLDPVEPPAALDDLVDLTLEHPDVMRRLPLQDLNDTTCRWPVGDPAEPGFFFCGNLSDNTVHPYCRFHRQYSFNRNPSGWRGRGRPSYRT